MISYSARFQMFSILIRYGSPGDSHPSLSRAMPARAGNRDNHYYREKVVQRNLAKSYALKVFLVFWKSKRHCKFSIEFFLRGSAADGNRVKPKIPGPVTVTVNHVTRTGQDSRCWTKHWHVIQNYDLLPTHGLVGWAALTGKTSWITFRVMIVSLQSARHICGVILSN